RHAVLVATFPNRFPSSSQVDHAISAESYRNFGLNVRVEVGRRRGTTRPPTTSSPPHIASPADVGI
ncbi:hypothetical protein ACFWAY_53675, partial [Rhodococcus sp. NPDC059968]|uniref:hypothetical protein n=1 Tax=Rhodococcus sp. NPDC059968 TaxID=3347017 RepID=UPI0036704BAD